MLGERSLTRCRETLERAETLAAVWQLNHPRWASCDAAGFRLARNRAQQKADLAEPLALGFVGQERLEFGSLAEGSANQFG